MNRRSILILIIAVAVVFPVAVARGAWQHTVDPESAYSIVGPVSEYRNAPGTGVPVLVVEDVSRGPVEISLAPPWYLAEQNFKVAVGDDVQIQVYECSGCSTAAVAASVVNTSTNSSMTLRDQSGFPAWQRGARATVGRRGGSAKGRNGRRGWAGGSQPRGAGPGAGACNQSLVEALEGLPKGTLSAAEKSSLIQMREEEKLARDVYTTLAEHWDVPVFFNIPRAEQRHMDLVAVLLARYDIADPVVDDTIGVFTDPAMTELFNDLIATGQESLEQALIAGATIEDLDLADLEALINATDKPDLRLIANNLAKGSRNHLRAFAGTLNASGFDAYVARYLTQERVNEIIAEAHERGIVYDENGDVMSRGQGGRGRGCSREWGRGRRGPGGGNEAGCGHPGRGGGRGNRGPSFKGNCQGRTATQI